MNLLLALIILFIGVFLVGGAVPMGWTMIVCAAIWSFVELVR